MHCTTDTPPTRPLRTPRRLRLAVSGALAGLALAVGAPLAASAHVHVTPGEAAANTAESLVFSFTHGCDEAPTTGLGIEIPEGVGNVVPVAAAGWSIQRDYRDNGTISRVVFTAHDPIENGIKAEVALDVRFDAALADSEVAFPVVQTCTEGSLSWTQMPGEGEDAHDLESPAPVIAVGAAVDSAAEGDHAGHGGVSAAAGTSDAAVSDPVARWLAGGALAAGVGALAVAVVAVLRRRA